MAQENLPLPVPDGNNNIVDNITGLIGAVNGVLGQVNVTDNFTLTNSLLDTVQNIKTTSAPRFAGLRIGALSGVSYLTNGTMSALIVGSALSVTNGTLNVNVGPNLTINGALDTIQDIQTDSSPVFAGVTVENFTLGTGPNAQSGLLAAINGVVAPVSLVGTSLTFSTQYNVLNTIQDIRTTAYPSFRGLTIGNTSGLALLTAGVVSSVALGTGLSITDGVLNAESGSTFYPVPDGNLTVNELGQGDTIQNIKIISSPTFAGLTLTGKNGILYGNAGVINTVTVNDNLIFSSGALNTVQNIKTTSTPTFAGLTLSGFTGLLISASGTISTVSLGSGLKNTAGVLDTIQPIDTSATPAFSGLTLGIGPGEFNGILGAIHGIVAPVSSLGTSLTFNTQYNTLTTVQDIRTTATVTFHTVNLTTLNIGSATGILYTNAGLVGYVHINPNLTLSSGILDTVQGIQTTSTPAFAGLTLGAGVGAFNGILSAINGVVQPVASLGTSLTFNTQYNTLTTVQDIRTTATPTFASLILGGLTLGGSSGVLLANGGAVYVETLGANLSIASGSLNLASNISVAGLTVGSGSGFAWLTSGVVSAALLSGNLRNTAGTVDLADQIAVGGLTVGALGGVLTATAGIVGTATIGARLTYAGGILNAAADQSFATLTLGTLTGLLQGTAGVVSAVTLDPNLTLVSSVLAIKATPSFTGLKLNLIDGVMLMQSGSVSMATLSGNLILTGATLSVAASPSFTGLTLGTLSGLLYATSGIVGKVLLDANLTLTGSSLALNDTPTFEGLILGTGPGAFNGILGAASGVVGTITRGLSLTFNSNTLDTVQDIRTTATVTFHTVNLSALNFGTSSGMLITNGGAVGYSLFGSNLSFSANTLSINSSPSFSGLTIGTLSGLLYAVAGVVDKVVLGSNLFLTSNTLSISSSPSFSGLTIGTLSGLLYGAAGVVGQSLFGSNLSFTAGTLSISSTPNFSGATIGTTTALIYRNAGLLSDIILDPSLTLTGSTLAVNPSANFSNITLGTLTGVIYATVGVVSALTLGSNLTITNSTLDVTDPPVFSGLTLGTGVEAFAGILGAIAGQVSPVNLTGTSLTFSTQYNILNTVQDIRTTASPTFAALTLSSLTASQLIYTNASKQLSSATVSANLSFTGGLLDTIQNIQTTSTPQFSGLTLGIGPGLFEGILGAVAGVVGVIDRGPSITFSLNTLDTIQDIRSTASPTFSSLTLSGLTASRLLYLSAVKQITSAAVSANLGFASGILDTVQDIQTTSGPTFAGLTLSGLTASRLLYTNATKQLTSAAVSANLGFVNGSLDTVQDIQTSSSPTFTGLTLSGLTASRLLYTNATKQLTSAAVSANLGFVSGILDTVQGIQTSSSPTFAGLTLGVGIDALDGILGAAAGVVGTITRGLSLTFNLNTLDTIQDIRSTASPTFSTLTLSGLTASRLLYVNAVKLTASAAVSANLTFTSGLLDTIQGIQTTSSPQFTGLTVSGLTASQLIYSNSFKQLTSAAVSGNLSFTSGLLDTVQGIQTTSSPQFSGLTLGLGPSLFAGILGAVAGVVGVIDRGPSITFSLNTLDTIQDIRSTASPTFSALTLSGLTASRLLYADALKQIASAAVSANLTFTSGLLDTVQGIQTTSSPQFTGLTLSSLTASTILYANGTKQLTSAAVSANLSFTSGTLDTVQGIQTTSSPQFSGLTLGLGPSLFNGILGASFGVVSTVTPGLSITFSLNTLDTIQDIRSTASPTFSTLTLSGLTASRLLYAGTLKQIASAAVSANLTFTSGLLDTVQGIQTTSSPQFSGLTLGLGPSLFNGILAAASGVVGVIDRGPSITFSLNTLDTIQDIRTTASPTFSTLTLSGLTASRLIYVNAVKQITSASVSANLTFTSGLLDTIQDIQTISTPTFAAVLNSSWASTNVICGTSTFNNTATGTGNVLVGNAVATAATSMINNVMIGNSCEPLTTTASNCVLVGAYAKLANVIDSNSIAIGFGANGQGSNTAVYGNAGITNHYFTSGMVNMASLTLNNIAPNNGILYATAGVVSALSLSNLATALSGSSPSFNVLTTQNLTLRNVFNGLLKATAGVISQATAGIDYQAPMSGSGNLTVSGNTIFINSSPTFNVLTVAALVLSNVASGILKSSAGSVVQAAPNIDYQPPITPGSNLTLYGATLAVLSTPTFTGINCTTLGTQNTICGTSAGITLQTSSTDNALFGYQAGQSITSGSQNVAVGSQAMGNTGVMTGNGQNVAVGYQSLYSLSGATLGNVAIGGLAGRLITTSVYNVSIGASANQALVTGNGNNVAIGASSGFITTNSTGSYGTYIGANANPSGASVIGELVMSNTAATVTGKGANTAYLNYSGGLYVTGNIIPNCNTTSNCYIGNAIASSAGNVTNEGVINVASSTATGRGANTMFINAPAGLYSYNPAYCMLYSTAFNNGNVTWAFWNDGTTTYNQGFTLYNSNTLVVQPFNGLYEINFSGTAVCSSTFTRINLNVNNIKVYDVSYNSGSAMSGWAVSINGSTLSRPYALAGGTSTGWSVAMLNCYYWRAENPLFMMIKFIGL